MIKKIFLSLLLCTMCMFAMAQSTTTTHIVQRGETLESIAEQYNVSVDDINKANPNTDGIIYVGMKLNIPVGTASTASKTTPKQENLQKANQQDFSTKTTSDRNENFSSASWERNQPRTSLTLTFFSGSFDDVSGTSHYGLAIDAFNIGNSLFGFNVTLGSVNYGLVESKYVSDQMLFGPNVSYEVAQNFLIALPVQATCNIWFDEKSESQSDWGWAISPRAYYFFGKINVHAGIMINGGFEKKQKVSCGFTAGLGFTF